MSLSSTSSVVAVNALLVRDVDGQYRPARAEEVLSQARRVLSQRVRRGATMSSPQAVKDYLLLEIGVLEHEVFCVLFLDAQHRIIELKQMFRGTVTQTSVYPREVVKAALACNSAAVVLAHEVHSQGQCDEGKQEVQPYPHIGPLAPGNLLLAKSPYHGAKWRRGDHRDASSEHQQHDAEPERENALGLGKRLVTDRAQEAPKSLHHKAEAHQRKGVRCHASRVR